MEIVTRSPALKVLRTHTLLSPASGWFKEGLGNGCRTTTEGYHATGAIVSVSACCLRFDRDSLRAAIKVGVAFHGHNNLSLPVANSVIAIEHGARWIDACPCGLGAGAGNTPTEVLAAVLDKTGYVTSIDLWKIMDVAEEIVRLIMQKPARIGKTSLTMGYAGVYSSFLLPADKAAQQFGVDGRDILVELGKRKAVGGQEDMIVEVAMMLAERRKRSDSSVAKKSTDS